MKKKIIRIIFIFIICSLLSIIPYSKSSTIITTESLTNYSLTLFGTSLAILALLFTVIDRYKENCEKNLQNNILDRSLPVLKNVGEDVMGLFIIVVLLFVYDLISVPIAQLQTALNAIDRFANLDIIRFLLVSFTFFLLYITFDITIVVITLINGLFKINRTNTENLFEVSLDERNLLTQIRKLHPKYINELLEYLKTLYVKQQIEDSKKE
jgi:hypothetical protein|nr:MAG TPA: hypothetical protein [Caudoviricetes sp.]